jgi:hypothetical protein
MTLQEIEQSIAELTAEQLAKFHNWYAEFRSDEWDKQIQTDAKAGKLDKMAEAAIAEHEAGRSKPL